MIKFFIDDTGSPGIVSESIYDSKDAKTWVALILNDDHAAKASYEMKELLKDVRSIGASEFHFKDIFQGKGEFETASFEERLTMIHYFADFYRNMGFPLLIQTMAPEDYLRHKIVVDNPKFKVDNFKLNNSGDLALVQLLVRIKNYLRDNGLNKEDIEITIDSGRQKGGTTQPCSLFGNKLKDGVLKYETSHHEPLLQLVDFAAFMLNKQRLIISKNNRNEKDQTMWEIFNHANFNVLNIVKKLVRKDANTVKIYDELLRERFEGVDVLPDLQLEELIKTYYQS